LSAHTFEIHQDGMMVAGVFGENRDEALREAVHYAAVYGQDGPVELFEVKRGKRQPIPSTAVGDKRT
jgi:hypothetical protein